MCRLYGKFASYLRRVLCKRRLIFSRINGPIVSPPLWIFMIFFLQNSSLLFSISRSSSFSVIHVSVNIKNNVEKDTTLLYFLSFLKSLRPCDFVAFRLPYLLIKLFYIGMPVVRTDSQTVDRSVGVQSRDYQIFSDGQFIYHLFSPMVLRWARFARESSAITLYIARTFSSSELVEPHINAFKVRLAGSVERIR